MSFMENLWKAKDITYPSNAHIPVDRHTASYRQLRSQLKASHIDVGESKMARAACRRVSRMEFRESGTEDMTGSYSGVNLPSSTDTRADDDMYSEGELASNAEVTTLHHRSDLNVDQSTVGDANDIKEITPSTTEDTKKCGTDKSGSGPEYTFRGQSYPVHIQHEFHSIIFNLTNSYGFTGLILAVILLNTIILVVSTSYVVRVHVGWYFSLLDNVFLTIYIMEIVLKIYAWRSRFFKDGWNIMDLIIVVFNLVEFILPLIIQNMRGFNGIAILRFLRVFRAVRAIRALRVLRTIRFLSNLQVIMGTVVNSIRSIGAIVLLITLFMYMFAVIGRGLYAKDDPNHFGNLYVSFFTLFQLLTMDDWFEIYEAVIKSNPDKWHIIVYLLLYIVVEYLIFLNLFVAVLVDNFQLLITAETRKNKVKASQIKSADEEYLLSEDRLSTSSTDSDDDMSQDRKDLSAHHPGLDPDQHQHLHKYFQLLVALEYNQHVTTEQHRVIDQMVDICGEM